MQDDQPSLYQAHIEHLQQRSRALLQAVHCQWLVLHAGHRVSPLLSEQSIPFSANVLFRQWLSAIDSEHAWLIIDGEHPPKLLLLAERFQSVWQDMDWWTVFDVQLIDTAHDVEAFLPSPIECCLYLGPHPDIAKALGFEWINIQPAIDYLQQQRAFKTDYEQFCLRRAGKLARRGMTQVREKFLQGASGLDIYLGYLKLQGTPFLNEPAQLAFNQQIGHLQQVRISDQPIAENNRFSLWFNSSAQYRGYRVRIARTFGFRRDGYSEMNASLTDMRDRLLEQVHLERSLNDLHRRYQHLMAHWLIEHELVTTNVKTCIHRGVLDALCPLPLIEPIGLSLQCPQSEASASSGGRAALQLSDVEPLNQGLALSLHLGVFFNPSRLQQLRESEFAELINWPQIDMLQQYGGMSLADSAIVLDDQWQWLTTE